MNDFDTDLDNLEERLSVSDPDHMTEWLISFNARDIQGWGFIARQQQRRRGCTLLCRLAHAIEYERGSLIAIQILEAAQRCSSLPQSEFHYAVILSAACLLDTPFTRFLYDRARSQNLTNVLVRLNYLCSAD